VIGVGHAGQRLSAAHAGLGWQVTDLASLDPERERPYWIALSVLPGMGPVGFGAILARFGSAQAAWQAGDSLLDAMPRRPAEAEIGWARLRRRGAVSVAGEVTQAVARAGGRPLLAMDADYPGALTALDPRPPVLYVAGDVAALALACVAVVGTRAATGYGRACAIEIADELARAQVTVVSGLAIGIDGAAHAAALAAGGRTAAVLPSPLDPIYPPRHRGLAARIVRDGGCLLTEVAPGQVTGRPDFARRNRIIAGLARAVVVVEAPDHSGALLTAAAAHEIGREVFAVPGPIDAATSRGCNRLIADHHARLVTSAGALVHHVGARRKERPPSVASLSESEGRVLYALLSRAGSIEELIDRTQLATGAVASVLTLLESRGLVESFGGATFHPTLAARRIGRPT